MTALTFVVILLSLAVIIISVSMWMLVQDFREVRIKVLKLEASIEADDFADEFVNGLKDLHIIEADRKTEPQLTEKCPFDDSLPCEWVCTEYGKCKYRPKDEPQTESEDE